jgi:prepilin-type processing-associated H-X9-DG protein
MVNVDYGGPRLRHLDTANVLYVDGHVKAMRADKWYFTGTTCMSFDGC